MRCTPTVRLLIVLTLLPRYCCPLNRLAPRLLLPRSGLERSDFVLWPKAAVWHPNRQGRLSGLGPTCRGPSPKRQVVTHSPKASPAIDRTKRTKRLLARYHLVLPVPIGRHRPYFPSTENASSTLPGNVP